MKKSGRGSRALRIEIGLDSAMLLPLRSRNQSSQLVPVRRSDVSVTVQPSGRAQPDRAASTGAGALGRTAQLKETDNR